eukprot:571849-Rhodomonas_salina.1
MSSHMRGHSTGVVQPEPDAGPLPHAVSQRASKVPERQAAVDEGREHSVLPHDEPSEADICGREVVWAGEYEGGGVKEIGMHPLSIHALAEADFRIWASASACEKRSRKWEQLQRDTSCVSWPC